MWILSQRLENRRAGTFIHFFVQEDFKPTAEALDPAAPHWTVLVNSLAVLRKQAESSSMPPTWAYQETPEGSGRPRAAGPVLASMIKTHITQADKSFKEQVSLSICVSVVQDTAALPYASRCVQDLFI